jgi:hypothetical protein
MTRMARVDDSDGLCPSPRKPREPAPSVTRPKETGHARQRGQPRFPLSRENVPVCLVAEGDRPHFLPSHTCSGATRDAGRTGLGSKGRGRYLEGGPREQGTTGHASSGSGHASSGSGHASSGSGHASSGCLSRCREGSIADVARATLPPDVEPRFLRMWSHASSGCQPRFLRMSATLPPDA